MDNVSYDFSGKTVVVTGGARGMGRSHVLGFAADGANVVVIDTIDKAHTVPYEMSNEHEFDLIEKELKKYKNKYLLYKGSVTNDSFISNVFKEVNLTFGSLDILVNNAGVNSISSVEQMSTACWQEIIDVNLTGPFITSKYASHYMQKQKSGNIINISSCSGVIGVPNQSHYSSSKHGLIGLSRSLSLELGEYGVRVNVVAPNVVNTPQCSGLSKYFPEALNKMQELYGNFFPLASCKIIDCADVTHAVKWLASDAARYITGVVLPVDAGFLSK